MRILAWRGFFYGFSNRAILARRGLRCQRHRVRRCNVPGPARRSSTSTRIEEIRLYSHSDIFYWWPVWALGFFLALLTYLDGGRLAVVPAGTEARRDWRVEVAPGRIESREGLILPRPTLASTSTSPPARAGQPGATARARAAPRPDGSQPVPGDLVLRHDPGRLRQHPRAAPGLWEWVAVLVVALVVAVIALYGWWGTSRAGSGSFTSRSTWPATSSSRPGCSPSGR